jgi:IS1 family transposase
VAVELISYNEIAGELDEMWSFVQNKGDQRWLWLAIHHETRVVLAYTFGTRTDDVFRELKSLLEPFGITVFFTDDWGAYERNLPEHNHYIGKSNTQRIERKKTLFCALALSDSLAGPFVFPNLFKCTILSLDLPSISSSFLTSNF